MRYLYIFLMMCFGSTADVCGFVSAWRAASAYKNGNYEKAQRIYQDMVADSPSDNEALFNLGKTAYKLNNFSSAAQCFDKVSHGACLTADKKVQAYFQLGDAQLQLHNYQDALAAYENALQLDAANTHAQQRIERVKKIIEEQKKQKKNEQSPKDKKSEEQSHKSDDRDELNGREQQQGNQDRQSTQESAADKQRKNDQTAEQKNRADHNKKSSESDEEQRDPEEAQKSGDNKNEHNKPVNQPDKKTTQDIHKDTEEAEESQEEDAAGYGDLDEQDISLLQEIEAAQSETGKREMQRYIKHNLPEAHGYKNW